MEHVNHYKCCLLGRDEGGVGKINHSSTDCAILLINEEMHGTHPEPMTVCHELQTSVAPVSLVGDGT